GIDEIHAAARALIHVVRLFAVGDVAIRRGRVVVPRAVALGRTLVVVRVGAVRRHDDVVGVAVRAGRGIAEVRGRRDRLVGQIGRGRCAGCRGPIVVPGAGVHATALVR